ncbi:MAG TPA: hypothetical protein VLG48_11230 [Candidatus Methylomirabilis sp.]|nr:hypothetical protein [Candidatus Methylomirabilis sp.]
MPTPRVTVAVAEAMAGGQGVVAAQVAGVGPGAGVAAAAAAGIVEAEAGAAPIPGEGVTTEGVDPAPVATARPAAVGRMAWEAPGVTAAVAVARRGMAMATWAAARTLGAETEREEYAGVRRKLAAIVTETATRTVIVIGIAIGTAKPKMRMDTGMVTAAAVSEPRCLERRMMPGTLRGLQAARLGQP